MDVLKGDIAIRMLFAFSRLSIRLETMTTLTKQAGYFSRFRSTVVSFGIPVECPNRLNEATSILVNNCYSAP